MTRERVLSKDGRGFSKNSERLMHLYFKLPVFNREKAVIDVGWEVLDSLSAFDVFFLGYPHESPQLGPPKLQIYWDSEKCWVGINIAGRRIRFVEEGGVHTKVYEWRINEGVWLTQDPAEKFGRETHEKLMEMAESSLPRKD